MDAGKVKTVLNALRKELHTRQTAALQPVAGGADDTPVLPARGGAGTSLHRDGSGHAQHHPEPVGRPSPAAEGVLVELSDTALTAYAGPQEDRPAPETPPRAIPEVVVPFIVPQEPLVAIAPYLIRVLLAAAAAALVMFVVL